MMLESWLPQGDAVRCIKKPQRCMINLLLVRTSLHWEVLSAARLGCSQLGDDGTCHRGGARCKYDFDAARVGRWNSHGIDGHVG